MASVPARAADYPPQELLDTLRQRLLAQEPCFPDCAAIEELTVKTTATTLILELTVNSPPLIKTSPRCAGNPPWRCSRSWSCATWKLDLTPLSFGRWFLLGVGLSQASVLAVGIVAGWILALGWRKNLPAETPRRPFNAVQAGLGLPRLQCWIFSNGVGAASRGTAPSGNENPGRQPWSRRKYR